MDIGVFPEFIPLMFSFQLIAKFCYSLLNHISKRFLHPGEINNKNKSVARYSVIETLNEKEVAYRTRSKRCCNVISLVIELFDAQGEQWFFVTLSICGSSINYRDIVIHNTGAR